MNKEEIIYPSMVIRIQAETIELLEQENQHLKEIEKEHQRINGELREENKQLKERIRIENNHPFIKPFVDKLPYVIVRNDEKLQLDEKSFDYLIKVEQQKNLYKEVIEEVRKYMKENKTRYIYQDNLGEDWWFEDLDVYSEVLQILDKGESNE